MSDKIERIPHEYLTEENYYENRPVGSGRSDKYCEHCGNVISKGVSHDVHKFYPEFNSYPTHKKCTKPFMASLLTTEEAKSHN
jgi:hypothetical protein